MHFEAGICCENTVVWFIEAWFVQDPVNNISGQPQMHLTGTAWLHL